MQEGIHFVASMTSGPQLTATAASVRETSRRAVIHHGEMAAHHGRQLSAGMAAQIARLRESHGTGAQAAENPVASTATAFMGELAEPRHE
jgi:hypothetical protein